MIHKDGACVNPAHYRIQSERSMLDILRSGMMEFDADSRVPGLPVVLADPLLYVRDLIDKLRPLGGFDI